MENKLRPTLRRIVELYYRTGLWRNDEKSTRLSDRIRLLIYQFNLFLFVIFLGTLAYLSENQTEKFFLLQVCLILGVFLVKLTCIVRDKNYILSVLHSEKSDQHNRKQVFLIKLANAFIIFVLFSCIFTGILSCLPIFDGQKRLPFFITFPFWNNKYAELIYWFAYAYVLCEISFVFVIITVTVLFWYIMLTFSIEYQVLGDRLRSLGIKETKGRECIQKLVLPGMRTSFLQDLIGLMKVHLDIFDEIERFRSCFSTLFFAQIATSGILICISSFNLAYCSIDNLIQAESSAVILVYSTIDIFLVLYYANEITSASEVLSYCLFESSWCEESESCKKHLIISSEILKRRQDLVILVYPMNLKTFNKIAKGAYTMFNILSSFKK